MRLFGGDPRSRRTELLTDAHWEKILPLLPELQTPRKKGRPQNRPERVIADKGYDRDPPRQRLKRRWITLLSPYRKNRKNKRKQYRRMRDRYAKCYTCQAQNLYIVCRQTAYTTC